MAAAKRSLDGAEVKSSKKAKISHENHQKTKDASRPTAQKSERKAETFAGGTGQSSREAHAKQKTLTRERKAARPNYDAIARSMKIWERIRRKSHVPKEERTALVHELFEIITGRVKEFVFKHDCTRVVQCALKYATPEQRKQITAELKGSYRELAESKYAKFLIAKMVVGDNESRDAVINEFYGHAKRLIRHPEASWLVDDLYRTIATPQQKAILLREWYGPEFVVFRNTTSPTDDPVTADLSEILAKHPEKRGPVMNHLHEMTNGLVQKKATAFTILHDALLQYFLNCKGSETTDFLAMVQDDEEGDLAKNLAFTNSGSHLLALCLAHGSAKDRRAFLKPLKTHIKLLASDQYGHRVLLTAYDVIDDTVQVSKSVFSELLSKDADAEAREQELLAQVEHLTARIPLLYLLSPDAPKWLILDDTAAIIQEVRTIRKETSKKDPEKRRLELLGHVSQPLLDLITNHAQYLAQSTFGCQFITETIFGCGSNGDVNNALAAIANLVTEMPEDDEKRQEVEKIIASPAVGRMLKALVQGGRFEKATKSINLVDPPLKFDELLYSRLMAKGGDAEVIEWANGPNSWVIVAMLESEHFEAKDELANLLRKNSERLNKDNKGAAIVLQTIGSQPSTGVEKTSKKRQAGEDEDASSRKQKDKPTQKKRKA
ncbi:Pumilio y domain member 6 [Cladophialophora chaetospira]|uniref:Pumilio y domain member 6 n=1 Tax=Cladophialophora chaetospira TaxID=386627 RepID=A0AA38X6H8_9EURO|nr:Pumilio y domain member 6 [Cladophialophora chaetospira]